MLAAEGVQRIPCEGLQVDPEFMTVLEVIDAPDAPAGTVIKELRSGYTWRGRVIRYAEVEAVRSGLTLPPTSDGLSRGGQPGAETNSTPSPSN